MLQWSQATSAQAIAMVACVGRVLAMPVWASLMQQLPYFHSPVSDYYPGVTGLSYPPGSVYPFNF